MAINWNQVKLFGEGTLTTLELTLLSMVIGTLLGLVIALGRISKSGVVRKATWIYVWVFRGTPLLLQIMIVYLAIPLMSIQLTGEPLAMTRFMSACIALTLNTAAYLAEIFRAGILSIDKGQFEAAKAVGMNHSQTMLKVIIPQTVRVVLPPYSNEFIMILKDTSLVSVIGLAELYRASEKLSSATGKWEYLFIAAAVYLLLTTLATWVFTKLEKRFSIFV
ncbi:MAG: amino acid ABC transporter permease [Eubacteriales bacterium]